MEDHFVKITNTTYKLLDFFPDGEPLKNKAKEKALAVLEGLTLVSGTKNWVSLKNYFSDNREKTVTLLNDIEILENYLAISRYQGWLDNMNFLIIMKEYESIKNEISTLTGARSFEMLSRMKLESENKIVEQNLLLGEKPLAREISTTGGGLVNTHDYSERQKKILQILSNREKTQVADIIKEIPDVTKRTLRRDLDDLLKKSAIVRIGEWNQVFYKTLKNDSQNQNDIATGVMQNGKIVPVAVNHSINDLAQFFDYSKGVFASNYNPKLAEKIRNINLPEKVTSIDQLESIIKNSLTVEEQVIIHRHLTERIDELRNET